MNPEIPESELKRIYVRIRTRRRFFSPPRPPRRDSWRDQLRRKDTALEIGFIALGATAVLMVPVLYFLDATPVKPASSPGVIVQPGSDGTVTRGNPSFAMGDGPGSASTSLSAYPRAEMPQDPIENLLERIQGRRFSAPEEVASGQFLRGFQVLVREIDEIDLSKLRPRRRGADWTVVRAHSRTDHEPWEKPRPGRSMQLRCARDGENWKVKQLIMLGRHP